MIGLNNDRPKSPPFRMDMILEDIRGDIIIHAYRQRKMR